jgi:hypothetical protein
MKQGNAGVIVGHSRSKTEVCIADLLSVIKAEIGARIAGDSNSTDRQSN